MTEPPQATSFTEIGVAGVREQGGVLQEEFLPQLRGPQGRKAYREMDETLWKKEDRAGMGYLPSVAGCTKTT